MNRSFLSGPERNTNDQSYLIPMSLYASKLLLLSDDCELF